MKTLLLILFTASLTLSTFGQIPSNYRKARNISDVGEKKKFVLTLDKEERSILWGEHFVYVAIHGVWNAEQRAFFPRLLAAFEADEMTDEIDQESKELFTTEEGQKAFIPGPFTTACKPSPIPPRMAFGFAGRRLPDCDCRQTGTNWSCNTSCDPSNSCTPTTTGCSVLWAYPCDGKCYNTKEGRLMTVNPRFGGNS